MGEPSNPSFSWIRDFRTCPWAPKPTIFIFGDPRIPQIIERKTNRFFKNIMFGNFKILKIQLFESIGKDGYRKIRAIRLINSWKSWIRDQYLYKNMKWKFGNMRSLNLWNFANLKQRNQETLKPRSQETKNLRNQETKNQETTKSIFFQVREFQHPSTYRLPPLHPTGVVP